MTLHRFLKFLITCLFTLTTMTANAASYRFQWDFPGHTVAGTFNGVAQGDRIFQPVLTSFFLDSVNVFENSSVFGPIAAYSAGPAYLSFTGDNNDFFIAISKLNADQTKSRYAFRSYTDLTVDEIALMLTWPEISFEATSPNDGFTPPYIQYTYNNTNLLSPDAPGWSVTQVPEPAILWLIASGLVSFRCLRRRVA